MSHNINRKVTETMTFCHLLSAYSFLRAQSSLLPHPSQVLLRQLLDYFKDLYVINFIHVYAFAL